MKTHSNGPGSNMLSASHRDSSSLIESNERRSHSDSELGSMISLTNINVPIGLPPPLPPPPPLLDWPTSSLYTIDLPTNEHSELVRSMLQGMFAILIKLACSTFVQWYGIGSVPIFRESKRDRNTDFSNIWNCCKLRDVFFRRLFVRFEFERTLLTTLPELADNLPFCFEPDDFPALPDFPPGLRLLRRTCFTICAITIFAFRFCRPRLDEFDLVFDWHLPLIATRLLLVQDRLSVVLADDVEMLLALPMIRDVARSFGRFDLLVSFTLVNLLFCCNVCFRTSSVWGNKLLFFALAPSWPPLLGLLDPFILSESGVKLFPLLFLYWTVNCY